MCAQNYLNRNTDNYNILKPCIIISSKNNQENNKYDISNKNNNPVEFFSNKKDKFSSSFNKTSNVFYNSLNNINASNNSNINNGYNYITCYNNKLSYYNKSNECYLPKSKINLNNANLIDFTHQSTNKNSNFKSTINSLSKYKTTASSLFNNKDNNKNISNNNLAEYALDVKNTSSRYSELAKEYFDYKTSFILKFSKMSYLFNKLNNLTDRISDNNKAKLQSNIYKLKILSEKRDNLILNTQKLPIDNNNFNNENIKNIDNFISSNLNNWKELKPIIYDQEILWIKSLDLCLLELKDQNNIIIHQTKKLNEKESILTTKEKEIEYLNKYIKDNDITYKSKKNINQNMKITKLENEYKSEIRANLIEKVNLESQITELMTLLEYEKNKKLYNINIKKELDIKNKEVEDLKMKLNIECEEKKMKIAYLINDKQELSEDLKEVNDEIKTMQIKLDENNKKDIEYNTNLKILKNEIKQKTRINEMLQEEVDTLIFNLYKEKKEHFNKTKLFENFKEKYKYETTTNNKRFNSVINVINEKSHFNI